VLENVRVAVQGHARSFNFWSRADQLTDCRERAAEILATVSLARQAERLAAHLSHGEKRHLEIGIALASDPALLLLDEPTAGMSPEETDETMVLIRELARGRTVVLVEHKMKLVMGISDRLLVLHHGELLAEGTPGDIRRNETVKRVYVPKGVPDFTAAPGIARLRAFLEIKTVWHPTGALSLSGGTAY